MKKKTKKIVAILLISVMICSMNIACYAAVHEHAYSYMGDAVTSNTNVGSHQYTRYNSETGKMETLTCVISAETHAEVWKCACGSIEYRNPVTYTHHSLCGL